MPQATKEMVDELSKDYKQVRLKTNEEKIISRLDMIIAYLQILVKKQISGEGK